MFSSNMWPLTGCLAKRSMEDTWELPWEKSHVMQTRSSTANLTSMTVVVAHNQPSVRHTSMTTSSMQGISTDPSSSPSCTETTRLPVLRVRNSINDVSAKLGRAMDITSGNSRSWLGMMRASSPSFASECDIPAGGVRPLSSSSLVVRTTCRFGSGSG